MSIEPSASHVPAGPAHQGAAPQRDRQLADAIALRESGRREEARELLVALAARFPHDVEVAYQTAWVHDTLGLEAEAVPYYVTAVSAPGLPAEDRAGALLGLGSTYRALGRYSEAVETLERGCAEFPEDRALRTFLALALHNAGRGKEGMELLLGLLVATTEDPQIAAYRPALEEYAKDLDATF
ncbi:tetratricopeptide repeat protein [Streptomyces indicus]|uniref:Tetratrico peptide repeat-containing protein n=1 Tax=Streptomyces indicus TaxID=417292 RepID=A0A1G8TJG8_9ACTN|nr:tetratricopeptide repeat protein [Streptomyces indicus]SDJ41544.1 Tetratrico peptide repeat-containing protein [Streptomyces indicus]